jgi:hypothetical protein
MGEQAGVFLGYDWRTTRGGDMNSEIFGEVPTGVDFWRCCKMGPAKKWQTLEVRANGATINRYPLESLSVDNIRKTFGLGRYRIAWCRGHMNAGRGRAFEVTQPDEEPAAEPTPELSPVQRAHQPQPAAPSPTQAFGALLEMGQVMQMLNNTFAVPAREAAQQQIMMMQTFATEIAKANASRPVAGGQQLEELGRGLAYLMDRVDKLAPPAGAAQADDDDEDEPEIDPSDMPKRALMKTISEVIENSPEIIGKLAAWLQETKAKPPVVSVAPAPAPANGAAKAVAAS